MTKEKTGWTMVSGEGHPDAGTTRLETEETPKCQGPSTGASPGPLPVSTPE